MSGAINRKILIADGDQISAKKRGEYLRQSGFEVKVTSTNYLAKKAITEWIPDIIIIDLMFTGFYALEALAFIKEKRTIKNQKTKTIVTSKHNSNENVKACIEAGASDYIVKPFTPLELLQRLLLVSQSLAPPKFQIVHKENPNIPHYFQMIELLVETLSVLKPTRQIRWDLVRMIAVTVKSSRSSLISLEDFPQCFKVIASSDAPNIQNLELSPDKYPEVQYVVRTQKPLFIESIKNDKLLFSIHENIQSIQFDSMILLPIFSGPNLKAVLSLRMPDNWMNHSPWKIKIAEIGAQLLASTWKFSPAMEQKKAS